MTPSNTPGGAGVNKNKYFSNKPHVLLDDSLNTENMPLLDSRATKSNHQMTNPVNGSTIIDKKGESRRLCELLVSFKNSVDRVSKVD